MKKKFLILISCIFLIFKGLAQPEIISVVPSVLMKSQNVNLVIKGGNTHFAEGITILSAGSDIEIKLLTVNNPELLTAVINVKTTAKPGFVKIVITTGSEKVELEDAVEIIESGNEVVAMISLMPVSNLFLSDFDPNNIKNAPLLFNIQVVNDNQKRNMKVSLSVFNDVYGKFAGADKKINDLSALATVAFNNREFDDYSVNSSADKLFQLASQTGMLPSGNYRYLVEVFDENNNKLAEDDVTDYISNDISDIEIIGPGNELEFSPEVIPTFYPYFQWFSQASTFDISVFEVLQGQKTIDEISNNIPYFQQKSISNKSLIYPVSAQKLEAGKTYAWMVKAYFFTPSGEKNIISDMFWFNVSDKNNNDIRVITVEIIPEAVSIPITEKIKFNAFGYDDQDTKIPLNCSWRVIPEEGGTINQNGEFTAGKQPRPVAVVAEYYGVKAYATVNILWEINNQFFDIGTLFDQIFGIKNK